MEGLNVISNSTCIFNIVVLVHSLSVNQQRHLLYICLNERVIMPACLLSHSEAISFTAVYLFTTFKQHF